MNNWYILNKYELLINISYKNVYKNVLLYINIQL